MEFTAVRSNALLNKLAITTPEPATLAAVADHITEIITSGTHNQTKALVEALVAKVTITAPDRLIPVFHIPPTPRQRRGRNRPTSGNGPDGSGSHSD
jgi:hypothetical protein